MMMMMEECKCHRCGKPIVENYYCLECDPQNKNNRIQK